MNVSASKVTDLHKCSMSFYLKHVLMIPDGTHWKTLVGSALHNVVEYVLKPKRRALLDQILAQGFTFAAHSSIDRYCKAWRDHHHLDLWDHDDVERMLALTFDTLKPYLGEGQFKSEQRFEMDIGGGATASGYIDIMSTGSVKKILDMKTKGQKFTKKELPGNIQAAIYQMYYYVTHGELVPVDFIMTRHPPTRFAPQKHIQTVDAPTAEQLEGLKVYLRELYHVMNSFTAEQATQGYCADTFFCQRVCSFYKGPVRYWSISKRDTGAPVRSVWIDPNEQEDLDIRPRIEYDEVVELLEHPGCPRFNR